MHSSQFIKRALSLHTIFALGVVVTIGCSDIPAPDPEPSDPDTLERTEGSTDFTSADPTSGQAGDLGLDGDALGSPDLGAPEDEDSTEGGAEERAVEEGDIYRVLDGSIIVNLNAYRGVQIIDFSDSSDPQIIGRLSIAGSPVELYVVGDQAYVLLNNWTGYYGSPEAADVDTLEGGVVLSVDLTDASAPEVTDQAHIPGYIQTSRLTTGESATALYVVTSQSVYVESDEQSAWETRTIVQSFDVSTGQLETRTQLDLGGYVSDIQATSEALLVARHDWSDGSNTSRVSIVDISDPAGSMIEGDEIVVAGYVNSQFNMDLYNDILRIVSSDTWGDTRSNHLQTFDASDFSNLTEIEDVTFGDEENLYATYFLGNKAFFVTYRRIDPYHAFAIDDSGHAEEMAEFVVTGWNDFFRSAFDDTRLVGVGVNDEEGSRPAISLYDITDLANPDPLLDRAEVDTEWGWSEASWDHRAFSVIEDAVDVDGPDGVSETGLVLLPFSGWSPDDGDYTAGVQIFTFSSTSVTRRGLMVHGSPVRRGILPDDSTAANLSETEISFFDVTDPDDPSEVGRLELAPNYTDVFVYGDYVLRIKNRSDYYYSWWYGIGELPDAVAEVVLRSEHPDSADSVAEFVIPYDAAVYQSADLLVAVSTRYDSDKAAYSSEIQVFDLSTPTEPVLAGTLTSDRLQPSYGYYDYGGLEVDGLAVEGDAPIGGFASDHNVTAVPGGLVFLQQHNENQLLGTQEICYTYATNACDGIDEPSAPPDEPVDSEDREPADETECPAYIGGVQCGSLEGAEAVCSGNIQLCSVSDDGEWSCQDVDADDIETTTECWEQDRYMYWQRYSLDVLDVRDASDPQFCETIEMPVEEQGVSMLADGSDIWLTHKLRATIAADSRTFVRYFIRQIDLQDLDTPVLADTISVPGILLAIEDTTIYTQDQIWGEKVIETSIAKLFLQDGLAYLQSTRTFTDELVDQVALDGNGHILISHRQSWDIFEGDWEDNTQHLTVLDAESDELDILADVEVAQWATLQDARAGRALFQVPGGLLVFNLDDAEQPYPQAYFPTLGWPRDILVDGRDIIFAAGRYGIYAFDLDTFNLLTSP